jgi:hypothetical protein
METSEPELLDSINWPAQDVNIEEIGSDGVFRFQLLVETPLLGIRFSAGYGGDIRVGEISRPQKPCDGGR